MFRIPKRLALAALPSRTLHMSVCLSKVNPLYASQYRASIAHPDEFWAKEASSVVKWRTPFDTPSRIDLKKGLISWFLNGKLNATGMRMCVYRRVFACMYLGID
jgi:hypothetical protein